MDIPNVSVIIPTYNRADTVDRAIQSVVEQTFHDWEILVIDDGSTDDTREVVAKFGSAVRYVCQRNSGRSSARNRGIELATGRFIAFLDSDDVFVATKLERQLEEMARHPDVELSHTSYARMDESGRMMGIVPSGCFTGNVFPRILTLCPIATPTVLVRTASLDRDLCFDEGVDVGEDIILWARLAARGPVLGIDECLSRVTVTADSSAASASAQSQALQNIIDRIARGTFPLVGHARKRVYSDLSSAAAVATLKATNNISPAEAIRIVTDQLPAEVLRIGPRLRRRMLVDLRFHAALRNFKERKPLSALRDLGMCLRITPLSPRPLLLAVRIGMHFMRTPVRRAYRAIRGRSHSS